MQQISVRFKIAPGSYTVVTKFQKQNGHIESMCFCGL